MKIRDRLFIFIQHLLPQHFLSALMYRLARCEWPLWKNYCIRIFIWKFNVNMAIAAQEDPKSYQHFNDFFTRRLKPAVRPIEQSDSAIISPVDGVISQAGKTDSDIIIQAKGKPYSLKALLAADAMLSEAFENGQFMTIYLAPGDYHRIHMPVAGQVSKLIYVPGDLFSVNDVTTRAVDDLFTRNERVINIFHTRTGKMAMIMVGAIFVGGMETVWAGQITPTAKRIPEKRDYDHSTAGIRLDKGDEMGRFNMGSTLILLFEPDKCEWAEKMTADRSVNMGQTIGSIH